MLSEFDFLKHLKNHFNLSRIGDDCAVFPKDEAHDYLITSDMLVEGVDFKLEWSEPNFIGHKALAVSLSDVTAMGGIPLYSMLSIGLPERIWKKEFLDEFYEGYLRLARKFKIELIGGDVSRTADFVTIDSTVIGKVPKGEAILRSGAKPGDLIYVSGELGGAAGGLELLERGFRYSKKLTNWQSSLVLKQLTPFPARSEELLGIASSMIDISDGLSSDLTHICESSGVGATVFAEKIPIESNLKGLELTFDQKLDYALHGGEDFELLFTAGPENTTLLRNSMVYPCGEITSNVGEIVLNTNGESNHLEPKGYTHF